MFLSIQIVSASVILIMPDYAAFKCRSEISVIRIWCVIWVTLTPHSYMKLSCQSDVFQKPCQLFRNKTWHANFCHKGNVKSNSESEIIPTAAEIIKIPVLFGIDEHQLHLFLSHLTLILSSLADFCNTLATVCFVPAQSVWMLSA